MTVAFAKLVVFRLLLLLGLFAPLAGVRIREKPKKAKAKTTIRQYRKAANKKPKAKKTKKPKQYKAPKLTAQQEAFLADYRAKRDGVYRQTFNGEIPL